MQPAGDNTVRAGGAWFQVQPTLGAARITGASIVRQGYIASAGQYDIYPAVQPDTAGNAAMVFTQTSKTQFPSAAYAILKAGHSSFGPAVVAASGTGPYDPDATRWGDYSFAVPDDPSDSAWLATEYIPPKSSQTPTGRATGGRASSRSRSAEDQRHPGRRPGTRSRLLDEPDEVAVRVVGQRGGLASAGVLGAPSEPMLSVLRQRMPLSQSMSA